jgi:DNA-binding transcriptional MerR regulator
MNFRELSVLTGVAERQIRYLIAECFVPSPRGSRTKPEYGDDHVAAIRRYALLREKGFPPAAIKLLLEDRYPVAPGVDLIVDHSLLGTGADAAPIIERVSKLLKELLEGQADDQNRVAVET